MLNGPVGNQVLVEIHHHSVCQLSKHVIHVIRKTVFMSPDPQCTPLPGQMCALTFAMNAGPSHDHVFRLPACGRVHSGDDPHHVVRIQPTRPEVAVATCSAVFSHGRIH
jgi:hypothetical protein